MNLITKNQSRVLNAVGRDESFITAVEPIKMKAPPGNRRVSLNTYKIPYKIFKLNESTYLHLAKFLNLKFYLEKDEFRCTILQWDIDFPFSESSLLDDIEKLIARKFLSLWGKAIDNNLNDDEYKLWVSIVDYIDMKRFVEDWFPARYMEGILIKLNENPKIEWHTGLTSTISRKQLSAECPWLEEGDHFSCYVKFSDQNQVSSLSNVMLRDKRELEEVGTSLEQILTNHSTCM